MGKNRIAIVICYLLIVTVILQETGIFNKMEWSIF